MTISFNGTNKYVTKRREYLAPEANTLELILVLNKWCVGANLKVNELFKSESSLDYKPEWVSVLDGSDEGAYMWVCIYI